MKISNEIKVGLLTFVGIVVLILGYNFLKGKNVFTTQKLYYAEYDRTDGLLEANPILLNGVQIGIVDEIYLKEDGSAKVMASLLIDGDFKVLKNTRAKIVSTSILGDKAIKLEWDDETDNKTTQKLTFATPGDTLQGALEPNITEMVQEYVAPIQEKAEKMIVTLDSVMIALKEVVRSDKMQEILTNLNSSVKSVNGTLENVEGLAGNLNDFTQTDLPKVSTILDNVEVLSTDLKRNTGKIDKIANNTIELTDRLAAIELEKTVNEVNGLMADISDITTKIKAGEGTIGQVMNDEELYHNIEKVTANLNRLLIGFNENPKDYFSLISIGSGKKREERRKRKEEKRARKMAAESTGQ